MGNLIFALALSVWAPAASAAAREWAGSEFTSIDERVCRHPAAGTLDCPGSGGYRIWFARKENGVTATLVAPDGRETTVLLQVPGYALELGSPAIEMIHVEWRREESGGGKIPYSIIVPVDAVDRASTARVHHFCVIQLTPGVPCLVEMLPVLSIDSVEDRYWTAQGSADAVQSCPPRTAN